MMADKCSHEEGIMCHFLEQRQIIRNQPFPSDPSPFVCPPIVNVYPLLFSYVLSDSFLLYLCI